MIEFETDEVFQTIRFQIRQLYEVVSANEESKKRQWGDDVMVLKAYINALSATRKVLQKEQATVSSRLDYTGKKPNGLETTENLPVKEELLEKLKQFRERAQALNQELQKRNQDLSTEQRSEERVLLNDEISVLQDTLHFCTQEVHSLELTLNRITMIENWKAEQAADWENLAHLKDQLTKLETKMDRAKRCLLFPLVHGYRFRVGSGGIYLGAKDLYISDFSAGISLSVETIEQSPTGEKIAVVRLSMGGHEARLLNSTKAETDSSDESVEFDDAKTEPSMSSSSLQTISSNAPSDGQEPLVNQQDPSLLSVDQQRSNSFHSESESVSTRPTEESESTEMTNALQQGASTGKRLALGFIKRISNKGSLQQKMSRASNVIRRLKKTPLSRDESLLKRFSLNSNTEATKTGSKFEPKQFGTPKKTEILSNLEPDLDRTNDHSPSMHETTPPIGMTQNHSFIKISFVPDLPDMDSSIDGERQATQRRNSESRKTKSFVLGDATSNASDFQSETMSLIGAGRRGVHVKLRGTHVNLFGEKGTRVPNMTVREIDLEVECSLSVHFEFSEKLGWSTRNGLKFEIVQLKKTSVGNSIPLPSGLVKTLLNLILPKIVERALLSILPKELGTYLIQSEKGMTTSGEISVLGPPLCTTQAKLDAAFGLHGVKGSKAEALKMQAAVQEAQNLLSLSPEESNILGLCFSKDPVLGLLDPTDPGTGLCSINALCNFHDHYSKSEIWLALCDLWNKAISYILKIKGWNCTLDFGALMNGAVGRLAAKPVRTQCLFTRLSCDVSVDQFVSCLRTYCERSARELHAEKSIQVSMPLDEQLKALNEWHLETTSKLKLFKSSFRSSMAALVGHADSKSLQIGLEKCEYEGPLSFKIPLVKDSEEAGLLSFDVSIPSPESSGSSDFMDGIYRAIRGIHHFRKTTKSEIERSRTGSAENYVQWGEGYDVGEKLERAILEGSKGDSDCQFNQPLNLGKVFFQKLRTSITLNEEKLREILLQEKLNGLIQKFEDLVSCDFAHHPVDPTQYLLNFKNSNLARFKAQMSTLGFQSSVSPAEVLRYNTVHYIP
eukprot:g5527.t2